MIDIATLRKEDIGKWVEYRGSGGEIERGKIKSWNDRWIFVVYHTGGAWNNFMDFTGNATSPGQLRFIKIGSKYEITK